MRPSNPRLRSCAYLPTRLVLFIFFIFIFGVVSSAIAQQGQEDFRQEAALAPGGMAVIENGRGDVHVEGWDKPEILVEGHKFFEGSDADRERWMRETRIRVEGDEHERRVKVEQPDDSNYGFHWGFWNGNRGVNLTVHVPRQVNAELKTDRGHVVVNQIAGKLEIGSDRGDVDVSGLDGELRFHGDRGNLKVRESAISRGVRVNLDRGWADIELRRFAGDGDLEVSRGNLTITLPSNAAFTLDAERSRRLSFHTDFGVLARGGFGGDHVQGEINGGGPMLRLRGDRSTVWLRKGGS